jgi:uncharacterized protein (TIGR03067 family)
MRILALSVVLLVMTVAAVRSDDDPEPVAPDARKFVGEWELAEIKFKGIAVPLPPNALKMSFKFNKDGTMTANAMGKEEKGKWKLDPRKSPRHLDLTGGVQGTGKAIYKIDKDQLSIGANQQANERPKDFDSCEMTMVLKRKKK